MHDSAIDPRVELKLKNEVLLRLRYHLCHKLEPQKYYPLLRQMKVFDEADEQEVRHMITSIDKASLLLDKIQKRDDAYDILTKVCTRITSQGYILQLMEEKMRELTREETQRYHGRVTVLPGGTDDDDVDDLPRP